MYLNTTLVQNASKDNSDPSNLTLDFSLKQLLSLKNIDKLVNTNNVQKLLLSTNYLKEIEPVINLFTNLWELDLSINHISRIENLYNLPNLKYLNLSNNRILKIEGLANLGSLEVLDLSMNYLTRIENLKNPSLKTLILSGNNIKELENLNHLRDLQNLELEKNQLTSISNISIFGFNNLKKIAFSYNLISIDYFDELIKTLEIMPTIEELNLQGNEVTLHKQYKPRILEFENIKILDKLALKDPIKKHFEKLRHESEIDHLIENTRGEYLERLKKESELKNATVEMIERQKKQVEDVFQEYEDLLSDDFKKFYEKARDLKLKRIYGEMDEYDTQEVLDQWKKSVKEKAVEKKREFEEAVKKQQVLQREYLETKLNNQKFTDKLYEISLKNPEVWRDIKLRERNQYIQEEEDIEKLKKKYYENADESEIQQYENLANQIQTSMMKGIADTVLDYEAKELYEQRVKAANVLKRALLTQMVTHYASTQKRHKKPAPEIVHEDENENEITPGDDQLGYIRPEVTNEEMKEYLDQEYEKGNKPKQTQKNPQPQNLGDETLDNLLQIKKGDMSYADKTREEIRQRKQKAKELTEKELMNGKKKTTNGNRHNEFLESLEDIAHGGRGVPRADDDLERDPFKVDHTYVDPQHVAGKQRDGEKIIFMPFPTEEPVLQALHQPEKKDPIPGNEEVQAPGEKKKKKKKKKKDIDPNIPQNVLDDLEFVDDNGLPEKKNDVPNYQVTNQPYSLFPENEQNGQQGQRTKSERKQTVNSQYQRPIREPTNIQSNNPKSANTQNGIPADNGKPKKTNKCAIF